MKKLILAITITMTALATFLIQAWAIHLTTCDPAPEGEQITSYVVTLNGIAEEVAATVMDNGSIILKYPVDGKLKMGEPNTASAIACNMYGCSAESEVHEWTPTIPSIVKLKLECQVNRFH